MIDFVEVKKSTSSDKETLQKAIDHSVETGLYTVVVLGGEWNVDETILIPDNVRLIFDGAKVNYMGKGFFITNNNSVTTYKNVIAAEQKGITISGKNGAEIIGGTVFLNNLKNCSIEDLTFSDVDYGVALTSTIGVKLKRLKFNGCVNGVILGTGASDIIINDISGSVEKEFISINNGAFVEYKKLYHPAAVKNVIVRNIIAEAQVLVNVIGVAEKLVFSEINGTASELIFSIKSGKHILIDNVNASGTVINEDYPKGQVIIDKKDLTR